MSNSTKFNWKLSKYIINNNFNFNREKILNICGEDNVLDAYNVISNWENYKPTKLLNLEKLSKILDLPSWHEVISLLRIGYLEKHNANENTTRSFRSVRRKTTDFVSYETYSQKKADEIKESSPA